MHLSLSFPQAPEPETLLLVRKLYLLRASTSVSLLNVRTVVVEELKWLQSVKMLVPSFCSILAEKIKILQNACQQIHLLTYLHLTGILATRFMKCCSIYIYKHNSDNHKNVFSPALKVDLVGTVLRQSECCLIHLKPTYINS